MLGKAPCAEQSVNLPAAAKAPLPAPGFDASGDRIMLDFMATIRFDRRRKDARA